MKDVIRVSVVDKHPLFRDGIILALNSQPDIEVVGRGATAEEAIRIAQDTAPDVVIIDTCTLGRNMAAVETILEQNSRIGILFLADVADEEHVYAALRLGVRGYILKGASRTELLQAILVLSQGQSFISPSLAAKL